MKNEATKKTASATQTAPEIPVAIRDFVWCEPIQDTVIRGIIVPSSAEDTDNPREGRVVAVGCGLVEGGQIIPLKVQTGDHIYFPRNAGTIVEVKETGRKYFVLRENQIFGALR